MEPAKQALRLLAVDPVLKGVLIAAAPGSAKSVLARAFQSIVSPEQVPPHVQRFTPAGHAPPFVEVPLGVTEDRLLGGLDFERTLVTGKRHIVKGLLAQAHRGVLYVDEINLLDRVYEQHIINALTAGVIYVERDGVSGASEAEFVLIGTYDPQEGDIGPSLADCVGLHVVQLDLLCQRERVEILNRVTAFNRDPSAVEENYAAETANLRRQVAAARSLLPIVEVSPDDQRRLIRLAMMLGVEGNRADIFAQRVARASAALSGRTSVQDSDLKAAVQLVLLPRATANPQNGSGAGSESDSRAPHPIKESSARLATEPHCQSGPESQADDSAHRPIEDLIIEALDAELPEKLLESLPRSHRARTPARAAQRRRGRREAISCLRGRYVSAVSSRPGATKIALDATLRAAAPHQKSRRQVVSVSRPKAAVHVTADDLRFKRFKQKAGLLVILLVDASGSMALNRMNQAKGAVTRLLQAAYLHRDKVALISFRGEHAEILLPPSRSVELAKRALDALPVGGGTPLAAGLLAALDLTKRAPGRGVHQSMLFILTDGRANVASRKQALASDDRQTTNDREIIWPELKQISELMRAEKLATTIIDTQNRYTSGGEGRALAELLGGRYIYLPRPDVNAVYKLIAAEIQALRA
jgi:magnesium chelatase subunit D